MAEQKPSPEGSQGRAPFVSDAADAADQEPPVNANVDRAIAAEKALKQKHPNADIISQRQEEGPHVTGEVKRQND